MVFADYTFLRCVGYRWLSQLTAVVAIVTYVYQVEVSDRSSFLNEREYESWKLDADDIIIEDKIGEDF